MSRSGGGIVNNMTPTPNPVNNLPAYKNEAFCNKVKLTILNQRSTLYFHTRPPYKENLEIKHTNIQFDVDHVQIEKIHANFHLG